MMDFIIMTASFALGMLLASGLSVLLVLNKKVMKTYMKYVMKMSEEITEELLDEMD